LETPSFVEQADVKQDYEATGSRDLKKYLRRVKHLPVASGAGARRLTGASRAQSRSEQLTPLT